MEEIALRRRLLALEIKVSGLEADAARYRALLRARNDLIVELDEHGLISAVSPALLERSGFSASECLGRSTFDFTSDDAAARLREQSPTLFDWAARRHPFEIPLRCKDASELWLEGNIYAYTTDGGINGMFCLYRDITESKVLESENRRLGEGAAVALAISDTEAFEFDFDEGLIWQSPDFLALFGFDARAARSAAPDAWLKHIDPRDLDVARARMIATPNHGLDRAPVVVRVMLSNEQTRYVRVAERFYFNSDSSANRVVVSARDVSNEYASKNVATALTAQITEAPPEHAARRLALALQIGEVGVAEWSKVRGWFEVSRRFRDALGLAAEADPEKFEQFIKRIHPHDRDAVLEHSLSSYESGNTHLQRYRYRRPDGSLAHLESGAHYLRNAAGELESVLAIVRDQTELRAVEESLRSTLERLSVAMQIGNVHFFEHDERSDVYQVSSGFCELLGLNPDQPVTRQLLLSCIDPQDHARLPSHRHGAHGAPVGPVRFRVHGASGISWIESTTAFYFDDAGKLERSAGALREVTDQVLIEEEIRAQSNLFGALIEFSPDGVVRIDADARFVLANAALGTLIGINSNDIIGKTPEELPISRERAADFRARIERFFATGSGEEFELQFKKLPDAPWLLVRYVAEFGPDGKPKYLLAFLRDVSQLKNAEQDALASARQLGQIIETAEEGILVADVNNVIVFNNPKLEQIFGYASNEMIGKHERLLQLPDAEKQWQQRLEERHSGLSESYTNHFRRKDGSIVLCWVNARPLQDAAGKFSGTLAMLTDVTDIERSERELRQGIEWLEFSMESAQIAGMDIDLESGFSRTTVLFREWFGLPEDGEGAPVSNWISRVFEQDRARVQVQMQAILERGSSARADFRLVDSAGEMHWLYAVIVTVCNVGGSVARVVFTVVDITPRRKLEAEREALQNQVARTQREESLGTLASGFAHDLNNLLTTAFGHIDLARMLTKNADAENSLELVGDSLTQMTKLSEQLLAYSGKTPLNSKTINLNVLLEKIHSIMAVSVGKKAHFSVSLASELLILHGEESQLQQVALNLLLNAAESLEGRTGEIELSTRKILRASLSADAREQIEPHISQLALLKVSDTGIGIDANSLSRLFEPFFSTKGQGRGLGMSVVAGIVRAHKGFIEIQSSGETGTTISVYFPLEATVMMPVAESRRTGDTAEVSGRTGDTAEVSGAERSIKHEVRADKARLILVVDDEPTLRNLICRTLNTQGFETLSAVNGDEALVLLAERPEIALVLLDLTMPQRDGIEVYAEILAFYPKLAVMIMSGYSEQSLASRLGPDAPVPAFLHKPFRTNELLAMVRKTLAQS